MSTVVLAIAGALFLGIGVLLFLWSRWSDRQAAYEAEELSDEEANLYRLGISLGWDGNIASGNH
jgi:hypothetical protein